jgi:hypothetical protein
MPVNALTDLTYTVSSPAVTVAASASVAAPAAIAGQDVRLVARRVIAYLATAAAIATLNVLNLRAGLTGAGAVIAVWTVNVPANSFIEIDHDNWNFPNVGPAAAPNPMTLEWAAAVPAGAFSTANLHTFVAINGR